MGVPSTYTDEMAEYICERIAGGEALHRICAEPGMPRTPAVYRWLDANEKFRSKYARARDQQADLFAAEIILVADEEIDPAKARNRIDARKWAASKLAPKKYGDRVTNEHTGPDGGPMVVMSGVPRSDE